MNSYDSVLLLVLYHISTLSPVHYLSYYLQVQSKFLRLGGFLSSLSLDSSNCVALALPQSSSPFLCFWLPLQHAFRFCPHKINSLQYLPSSTVIHISRTFKTTPLKEFLRQAVRCCRFANILMHQSLIQQRHSSHACKSAQ